MPIVGGDDGCRSDYVVAGQVDRHEDPRRLSESRFNGEEEDERFRQRPAIRAQSVSSGGGPGWSQRPIGHAKR
jgi:hypothetical protein